VGWKEKTFIPIVIAICVCPASSGCPV